MEKSDMSNTSTLLYDTLISTSLDALKNTFSANFGFILVGILATVTNILELVTIIKNKKLHSRCYFLIGNLSVASIINGLSYIALGIKRLVRLQLSIPEITTKTACAGEMFTCSYGQTAIVFLPFATAVDRMYATTKPTIYKTMNRSFTLIITVVAWSVALLDSSFSFFGTDQNNLVANCNLVSATDLLYIVQSTVEISVTCLITFCYITLAVVLQTQYKKTKSRSETIAAAKMKVQIKVVTTLGIESSIHLLTQLITRIGLAVLTPLSAEARFQYAPFIRLIIILGSGMNLFVFILVNSEFKLAFKRTILRQSNLIVPFTTSHI